MSRWYLDTSAALKLIVEERESQGLAEAIDAEAPELCGCWLLETELRRAANRIDGLGQQEVSEFLEGVSLFEMPASLYREAGLLPGATLRSLDALHLAAAIRIGVDAVASYDERMIEAARALGLSIALAPS